MQIRIQLNICILFFSTFTRSIVSCATWKYGPQVSASSLSSGTLNHPPQKVPAVFHSFSHLEKNMMSFDLIQIAYFSIQILNISLAVFWQHNFLANVPGVWTGVLRRNRRFSCCWNTKPSWKLNLCFFPSMLFSHRGWRTFKAKAHH